MDKTPFRPVFYGGIALVGAWLGVKYAIPALIPFFLGGAVALGAEPTVRLLNRRAGLPRWAASGLGVSLVLLLVTGLVTAVAAFAVGQAGRLAELLPRLVDSASGARQWLLGIAGRMPDTLGNAVSQGVERVFSGAMTDGLVDRGLTMATRILEGVGDGFFALVTGVLAAYMISVRWQVLERLVPDRWRQRLVPELRSVGHALGGWVWAQMRLAGVAFLLMAVGFLLLRIPGGIGWAAGIAVVDAFPVLGCGTVLIPWGLICFLQGRSARGVGLLGVYALVWLVRSVLEPRMVGKELGLDPLVTLLSVYAGLKLFGFVGILLAPVAVMAVLRAWSGLRDCDSSPDEV